MAVQCPEERRWFGAVVADREAVYWVFWGPSPARLRSTGGRSCPSPGEEMFIQKGRTPRYPRRGLSERTCVKEGECATKEMACRSIISLVAQLPADMDQTRSPRPDRPDRSEPLATQWYRGSSEHAKRRQWKGHGQAVRRSRKGSAKVEERQCEGQGKAAGRQ